MFWTSVFLTGVARLELDHQAACREQQTHVQRQEREDVGERVVVESADLAALVYR
jgi:hypothetical protein